MNGIPDRSAECSGAGLHPIHGDLAKVLILGSFPSRQSLEKNEYYGNVRNHFWQIIEMLFHIDRHLAYGIRTAQLTDYGIALWDVIRSCNRKGSADTSIRDPVFNNIEGFLETNPSIHLIVLNGSTAGRYFRLMKMPSSVAWVVLPSTSPANTRFTLEEKAKAWEIIRNHGV